MISVLICDDAPIVRTGLRMTLEAEPDLRIAGEASGGEEALALLRHSPVDVLLLDILMPGMDGVEVTRRVLAMGGPTRVLILSTFRDDAYVHEALRAGASGFLLKDLPPERLVEAVRTVAAGQAVLAPAVTRRLLDAVADRLPRAEPPPFAVRLSAQDRRVLRLIAQGRANDEIAAALHLTPSTVKTYVSRLLAKMGARDRSQAVILAYEYGLVSD